MRHLDFGHCDRLLVRGKISCQLDLVASVLLQIGQVLIVNVIDLSFANKHELAAALDAFKRAFSRVYFLTLFGHGLMIRPTHVVTDFAGPGLLTGEAGADEKQRSAGD